MTARSYDVLVHLCDSLSVVRSYLSQDEACSDAGYASQLWLQLVALAARLDTVASVDQEPCIPFENPLSL